MGLIVLHSGHYSKPFRRLMGTSGNLQWREAGEKERLWVVAPGHPITEGLGEYFEIPHVEMYGEPFDVPQPDELVFVSGSRAARSSAADAAGGAGGGGSSTSGPATRPFRSTTRRKCSGC
jgi:trehalose utilization protein